MLTHTGRHVKPCLNQRTIIAALWVAGAIGVASLSNSAAYRLVACGVAVCSEGSQLGTSEGSVSTLDNAIA